MAKQKQVTGTASAFVKIGSGDDSREVVVHYGEDLPSGVSADEVKRLEGLGVFGDTPRHLLPVELRPPLVPVMVPTAELEATNQRLTDDLVEANAKLVAAARLGPVLAGKIEDVNTYIEANPDDRDAIMFLETNGQKRAGILED